MATIDQINAMITREDLDRYNFELKPLEQFYSRQLMGPQAEHNRQSFLQTVDDQTTRSFDRAEGRMNERRRRSGLQGPISSNESNRLQRHQQLSRAQNSTNASRFIDALVTDRL